MGTCTYGYMYISIDELVFVTFFILDFDVDCSWLITGKTHGYIAIH